MKHKMLIAGAVLSLMFSCSKDESTPAPTPKTKTQLIAAGAWKLDVAGLDLDGNGTIDSDLPPGTLEDCDKDNIYTFREDKTGTADEGTLKCDASAPQSVDFTWQFSGTNEDTISFSDTVFSGFQGDLTIKTLDEKSFVLSKDVTVPGLPASVTVIVKLKH